LPGLRLLVVLPQSPAMGWAIILCALYCHERTGVGAVACKGQAPTCWCACCARCACLQAWMGAQRWGPLGKGRGPAWWAGISP
jgi:hypothetical protein